MSKEYARVIHFAGERNDTNENVPLSSDRLNPIIQQTEFYEISTKNKQKHFYSDSARIERILLTRATP